jgi:hypothetical protein
MPLSQAFLWPGTKVSERLGVNAEGDAGLIRRMVHARLSCDEPDRRRDRRGVAMPPRIPVTGAQIDQVVSTDPAPGRL